MAQSAVKERALLEIIPFWERASLEPLLRWERGQVRLKLTSIAKEGISIDTLQEDPSDKVTLPPEPIYEANVENSTTQSERNRKTRNKQLKNTWHNRCQKIELAKFLCADKPWKFCDNKYVSLTYLSLGMEGRRVYGSQTIQIDWISTKDIWESLDYVLTKQRNITFNRYTFLTQKQLKREPVKRSTVVSVSYP